MFIHEAADLQQSILESVQLHVRKFSGVTGITPSNIKIVILEASTMTDRQHLVVGVELEFKI